MMPRFVGRNAMLFLLTSIVMSGGVAAATSYVVSGAGGVLPDSLDQLVEGAGGTVTGRLAQIGVARTESEDPLFAERLVAYEAIESVAVNPYMNWVDGGSDVEGYSFEELEASADEAFSDPDELQHLQWGLRAVGAADAWSVGHRGAGARVVILDSGIAQRHPDLAPNVNTELSRSFVTDEDWRADVSSYHFHHGTHVAGIIAAVEHPPYWSNTRPNYGVAGVAPEAEIVAFKVLSEETSGGGWPGFWYALMEAMVAAGDIDADVINMSLGGSRKRSGFYDSLGNWVSPEDVSALINALGRAATYAHDRGVTIIASAGNLARDANKDKDWFVIPSQLPHFIIVSATSPYRIYQNPDADLDDPAVYTNYGVSHVDLAAPGGDSESYPAAFWFRDLVISTTARGWWWASGTSMAAPHVAGVAAIIIGMNGGDMAPAEVEAELRSWADDLGKPGKDKYYGHGRVSARGALD